MNYLRIAALRFAQNGLSRWAPEMVTLDWMMPEMDGPEVARRVRDLGSERPPYILMLTARGEKADIVAGLEAGLTTTCPNPVSYTHLADRRRNRVRHQDKSYVMQRNLQSVQFAGIVVQHQIG